MTLRGVVCWVMVSVVLLIGVGSAGGALGQTVAWRALGPGGSGDVDALPACSDIQFGKGALAVDAAGNSIVVGCVFNGANNDYLTVKFAPDGNVLWSARYNGPGNSNDGAYAVAVDSAGDVLVTGHSYNGSNFDYATIKYESETGAQLWVSRYNGPANSTDQAYSVAVDSAGDALVTGSSSNGSNSDYATVKYASASGAQLWASRYIGPANNNDQAYSVALDSAGNVLVTGSSSNGSNFDYATVKYASASGAQVWASRYNGPANSNDQAYSVALDSAGDVLVTGYSSNGSNEDYATVKYMAATGAQLWASLYNGPANSNDRAYSAAVDSAGDVLVTGYSSNGSNNDYAAVKYAAATGAQLWASRYNGPANNNDQAYAVAVDGAGDVLVTGSSFNGSSNNDYATVKYASASGAQLWASRYNGPGNGNDQTGSVAVDSKGDVRVAGWSLNGIQYDVRIVRYVGGTGAEVWTAREPLTTGLRESLACGSVVPGKGALAVDIAGNSIAVGCVYNGANYDYQTVKFAPDGSVLWSARYGGPGNSNDEAYAVAVDSVGDVLITGRSYNGSNYDYATIKYQSATGAQLWASLYNGPANSSDQAASVVVDSAGDVLVTGYSSNGSNNDYATVKYASATGTQLWASRYNGPANSEDFTYEVAADSADDVLVTGYSSNGSNNDYATVKYASATGTQLWASRYNGPAISQDFAFSVTMDSAGDVLVTGASSNGTNTDYATVKYASATGTQLWASRYNGPANNNEEAFAVEVDNAGDVLVTGYSSNGSNNDYATVKYASATGAQLWASRYNGPANSTDYAFSVAVDSAGDVLVVGQSYELGGVLSAIATQRLRGTDGSQRWVLREDYGVQGTHRGLGIRTAADSSIRVAAMAFPSAGERIGVLRINDLEASSTAISADTPDPSVVGQAVSIQVTVTGTSTPPADGQVLLTATTGESCTDTTPTAGSGTTALFSCAIVFNSPGSRNLTAVYSGSATHSGSTSAAESHTVSTAWFVRPLADTAQINCYDNSASTGLVSGGTPDPENAGYNEQDCTQGAAAADSVGAFAKLGASTLKGRDYSKIANNGAVLPAGASLGSGAGDWACTRDNVTGLIWEVKLNNAAQLRHFEHTYTWYDTNASNNGGNAGAQGSGASCNSTLSNCNTTSYRGAVNSASLCSASDWRLPSADELHSLFTFEVAAGLTPRVDASYFPNTPATVHWAGENYAPNAANAWATGMLDEGIIKTTAKTQARAVRLVRGGQ